MPDGRTRCHPAGSGASGPWSSMRSTSSTSSRPPCFPSSSWPRRNGSRRCRSRSTCWTSTERTYSASPAHNAFRNRSARPSRSDRSSTPTGSRNSASICVGSRKRRCFRCGCAGAPSACSSPSVVQRVPWLRWLVRLRPRSRSPTVTRTHSRRRSGASSRRLRRRCSRAFYLLASPGSPAARSLGTCSPAMRWPATGSTSSRTPTAYGSRWRTGLAAQHAPRRAARWRWAPCAPAGAAERASARRWW
jgi:hypothetical protein